MNGARPNRGFRLVVTALAVSSSACTTAHETPTDWKAECVGRMQLSLPGEVDVAADTLKSWHKYSSPRVGHFPDEQVAGWSSYSVLGQIQVSHALTEVELSSFMQDSQLSRDKFRPGGSVQKATGTKSYRELSVQPQVGIAWDFDATRYAIFRVGSHVFGWTAGASPGAGTSSLDDRYKAVVNGLRSRDTFTNPQEPGLCLPYTFIRDDGKTSRNVGTTYRLRKHPDVTVYLRDAAAASHQNKEVLTAKYRTNDFWAQYGGGTTNFKSRWTPSAKGAELGGQAGMQTFVQFVRKDGTQDFGYLAVAPGDPEAKQDIPDLMLYVIRDAKNAKAKGIEPVSEDAFLEMAQTIAASVKRRPITAQ